MAEHESEFELALTQRTDPAVTGVKAMVGRYAQEVQGLIWVAKQFPRDQATSVARILEACKRPTLAEDAMYLYPRGKESITGPSIRLAEVLIQNWGNASAGVMELEQKTGESTCMAYAWDLETNTRIEKMFTVKHWRDTKSGGYAVKDQRDIYELVANYGARRQRACILSVIPRDIVDAAVSQCEKTMAEAKSKISLADRIKAMLEAFAAFGVTQDMIEKRAGYALDKFTEKDVRGLKKVHNSLKDHMATPQDYFDFGTPAKSQPSAEDEKLKAEFEKDKAEKAKAGGAQQVGLNVEG